jgi:DNA-binding response OmpR family regulator
METSRILIVDDEPAVCSILERSLCCAEYLIETAFGGSQAIDKLRQAPYDLMLLDLNMRPLNGIHVMQKVRELGLETQVIILTGYSTIESAVDALRLGAFDYLFKPTSPADIRNVVQKGLEHHRLHLRRQRLLNQIEQLKQALTVLETDTPLNTEPPSKRFLKSGGLVIDLNHRAATIEGRLLDLTTAEFDILVHLVRSAPQPVTPGVLVQEALNYRVEEVEAREIIKGHIYHLRQKIEPQSEKPRYIKTVWYKGYLWSG